MIKLIITSVLLLASIVATSTASAFSFYPTKNEYDEFIGFVDNFVTENLENEYYNQAIDTADFIAYSSYISVPGGPGNYATQKVEIEIRNISVDLEYELVGVDQPILINPTVYAEIFLKLTDSFNVTHSYSDGLVFNYSPGINTSITPSMLVRDGLPADITPYNVATGVSLSLQSRVISSTEALPFVACTFVYGADYDYEYEDTVSLIELINIGQFPIFNNLQYLGLPTVSDGISASPGYVLLTYNTVENLPNFFYTYLSAKDYGGVNIINPLGDIDFTSWLMNAIGGFMDAEFLPGISLSSILLFIISLGLMVILLRYFSGG